MTAPASSDTPTRGVSQYIDWQQRISKQIDLWEAEAIEINVGPTDKALMLLRYARDEIKRYDQDLIGDVVMGRSRS